MSKTTTNKQNKIKKLVDSMLFSTSQYHLDYVQLTFSFPTLSKSNYQKSKRYIQPYEHQHLKKFIIALCDNKNIKAHVGLISKRLNQIVMDNKFKNQWLWDYNRDSILIIPDTRHFNIKIHLKGGFFCYNTIKKDRMQLLIVVRELKNIILDIIKDFSNQYEYPNVEKWSLGSKKLRTYIQYNKPEENPLYFLSKVDYGDFFINRFDIMRNDYLPIQLQNYKEHYNQKKSKGKFQNLYTRDEFGRNVIWNVSVATKGDLKFKAYVKNYDEPKRQLHSQLRFGKSKYIRREWKHLGPRLRTMGVRYFSDFINLITKKNELVEVIKRMRKSYDITTPDDSPRYQAFHRFDYTPLIKKVARSESVDTVELVKEIKLQLKNTLRKSTDWQKTHITGSSIPYNPRPHIKSLIDNHGITLKTSQLLEIKEQIEKMIKRKEDNFPKDINEIDFWINENEDDKN
jgi:hypothetical protein